MVVISAGVIGFELVSQRAGGGRGEARRERWSKVVGDGVKEEI